MCCGSMDNRYEFPCNSNLSPWNYKCVTTHVYCSYYTFSQVLCLAHNTKTSDEQGSLKARGNMDIKNLKWSRSWWSCDRRSFKTTSTCSTTVFRFWDQPQLEAFKAVKSCWMQKSLLMIAQKFTWFSRAFKFAHCCVWTATCGWSSGFTLPFVLESKD